MPRANIKRWAEYWGHLPLADAEWLEARRPETEVSLHRDSPGGRIRTRESFVRQPSQTAFLPVHDRDVLVLAGDIGRGVQAREFVLRELEVSPVVYVPGNHEYCSRVARGETDARWQALATAYPGLHYLVVEAVVIDDLRFWGAPWYSGLGTLRMRRPARQCAATCARAHSVRRARRRSSCISTKTRGLWSPT